MGTEKTDVLVIGGGIVGACVARELKLAQPSREVTLIEKGTVGHGCSFANAGWLTPCFSMPLPQPGMFWKSVGWLLDSESPLHIQPKPSLLLARWMWRFLRAMNRPQMERAVAVLTALSSHSLEFYRALDQRQRIEFSQLGLLLVSGTGDGLRYANLELELMLGRGIEGQRLSRDELLAFEPSLKPLVKGGVFFPGEATCEPLRAVEAVVQEFLQAGGRIQKAEAYDFEIKAGRIASVQMTAGRISAETVVLATGSWSRELARALGLKIPILGGKGYSMSLPREFVQPSRPIMIVDRKIAVTPRPQGLRLAGTLELVDQDFAISPARVRTIQNGAREYLTGLDGTSEASFTDLWRGLRPCTPDGVPLIGRSNRLDNLYYCTGHQLLGLQSAPGSARLLADLLLARTPLTDPDPFRPSRFE